MYGTDFYTPEWNDSWQSDWWLSRNSHMAFTPIRSTCPLDFYMKCVWGLFQGLSINIVVGFYRLVFYLLVQIRLTMSHSITSSSVTKMINFSEVRFLHNIDYVNNCNVMEQLNMSSKFLYFSIK